MSERIYLDANAGLPVRAEVLEEYLRVEREYPANPASLHRAGRRAQGQLENARERIAALLGRSASEVVFTSGATEACNLALFGIARATAEMLGRKLNLLTSKAEHPAVLGPLRVLQQEGHRLQFLPIDATARVDFNQWPSADAKGADFEADLVAMQWANNETGAVQPLQPLLQHLPADALWFCDAVQGIGKLPWTSALESADSLVLSGHKFGAPKGAGILVLGERAMFEAHLVGGGHQRGRRPGTESPAMASALALAMELAMAEQGQHQCEWSAARACLMQHLNQGLAGAGYDEAESMVQCNHPEQGGLCNTLNLTFANLDGRMLLPTLDADGLEVSSGSACSSGSPTPSDVLLATGMPQVLATASIRVTFPPKIQLSTVENAARRMAEAISRLYDVAKR
jgi:cysteine desulfurase